jgi:hypothetical protein
VKIFVGFLIICVHMKFVVAITVTTKMALLFDMRRVALRQSPEYSNSN